MNIPVKPTPSKNFLNLTGREATMTAWKIAKDYGGEEPDLQVFGEFIGAWQKRHKKSTHQQSLV